MSRKAKRLMMCSKSEEPYILLDGPTTIPASGGTYIVSVDANVEWINSETEYYTSTKKSDTEMEVVVAENTNTTSRNITFTVLSLTAGIFKTWVAEQDGVEVELSLDIYTSPSISVSGASISVNVSSNTSWVVSGTNCTISPNSGTGDTSVLISVPANTLTYSRNIKATFTTSDGSKSVTWTATQEYAILPLNVTITPSILGDTYMNISLQGTLTYTDETGTSVSSDVRITGPTTVTIAAGTNIGWRYSSGYYMSLNSEIIVITSSSISYTLNSTTATINCYS